MKTKVLSYLSDHYISFQEFTHPALYTVEQANAREDKIPGIHCKTIFIKVKKWPYHLITIRADKKLDTKMFKMQAGVRDFSFASPEELMDQLQLSPWSVGIFWLINNPIIQLFIDHDIRKADQAGRHPNDNTSTVVISHEWLDAYLKSLKVDYKIVIL